MDHEEQVDDQDLAAGDFSSWLGEMAAALRGERAAEVPCGSCTACCTSSHFVHIDPDETEALAHIPAELLFPAPRRPAGHVLLGYDERGHCPMLVDAGCSIYDHRPRACRTYDCRIFPAAGVMPDGDGKAHITRRAGRWRFSFPTPADRAARAAVRAAAAYLSEHADVLPSPPASTTQVAVLAVRIHGLFLGSEGGEPAGGAAPDPEAVRRALTPASPPPARSAFTAESSRGR